MLLLVLSIGLHWALLQTVAWTGMIVSYSHDGSFSQAVSKSLDGKHPCCLCKMIQAGKKSEKKSEGPLKLKKNELFSECIQDAAFIPQEKREIIFADAVLVTRADLPPTPPPEFA